MKESSGSNNRGPGRCLGSSPPTPTSFSEQTFRAARPVRALLLCCLLHAAVADAPAQQSPHAPPTEPSPKLTPAEVVSAQLAALKNNDDDDTGIRITFRFASPGNQAQIGPIDRFIAMLNNPAYQPMINFQSAHPEPIEVDGPAAKQVVTLVASNGKRTRYLFVLSRQNKPPCRGCWMTDAVMRLDPMSGPVQVASHHAPDRRSEVAHAVPPFVAILPQYGGHGKQPQRSHSDFIARDGRREVNHMRQNLISRCLA